MHYRLRNTLDGKFLSFLENILAKGHSDRFWYHNTNTRTEMHKSHHSHFSICFASFDWVSIWLNAFFFNHCGKNWGSSTNFWCVVAGEDIQDLCRKTIGIKSFSRRKKMWGLDVGISFKWTGSSPCSEVETVTDWLKPFLCKKRHCTDKISK